MAVNLNPPTAMPSVKGVALTAVAAQLRYLGRDDLVLIELAPETQTAAVFTQNAFAAAPVKIAKQHLNQTQPRALLINMGNANAATGELGDANSVQSCELLAKQLNLQTEQVLPFSTGVIGEQLDMQKFDLGLQMLTQAKGSTDWPSAAKAIMTTDTMPKATSRQFELDGQLVTINGITKGSGMICPNMATMLGFVATDAPITNELLGQMLNRSVANSFNRITVDSDTSTNDAVTLSATAQINIDTLSSLDDARAQTFYAELESLMIELATSIVRDGEGATKFVQVKVCGAASQDDARLVAESVANSPLVKTALFAGDPNWGRLPMAIGKAPASQLDASKVGISVNDVNLMQDGKPFSGYTEEQGQAAFAEAEIVMRIELGLGDFEYHVWTSDLSHEYVSINADYRS